MMTEVNGSNYEI